MSGYGEIVEDVLTGRLAALEGPPLRLVEVPAADGGLDLLIYADPVGGFVAGDQPPGGLVVPEPTAHVRVRQDPGTATDPGSWPFGCNVRLTGC
ncbi:hypothetical protein QFZ22_000172 [Streptomyces canus]|uniref:Uncharacterized protein n=1 Tax=Streptomyces canus TaxID=58343 RepID=A0AAW8F295_9ACTN|nr:hypothetical protein [Streptomyces canus]MDQ0904187.1 hypothetical protein [Streptomyces canus]